MTRNLIHSKKGFTLAELMIAATLFVLVFMGLLLTYVSCLNLSDMSTNTAMALAEAKSQMEEIKNTDFNSIVGTYDNTTYTVTGLTGIGTIEIDNSITDLFEVTVTYCWQMKNGRIIGEDTNLNGVLDTGEDANGNGVIDSPVQLVTMIYDS